MARRPFVILAVLTLLCAGVVAVALPAEQRFRPVRGWRGQWDGFADQFGNPQVMATCAVGFAVLFSMVATFTYANFYLAAPPFSLGPAQLGSVFVVYLLGVVAAPGRDAAGAALRPAAHGAAGRGGRFGRAIADLGAMAAGRRARPDLRGGGHLHRAGALPRLRRRGGAALAVHGGRAICHLLLRGR